MRNTNQLGNPLCSVVKISSPSYKRTPLRLIGYCVSDLLQEVVLIGKYKMYKI